MKLKKFSLVVLSTLLVTNAVGFCGCSQKGLQINDIDKNLTAFVKSEDMSKNGSIDKIKKAYLDVVIEEATQIISQQQNCDNKKAKNNLFSRGYTIDTYYNSEIMDAINIAYSESEIIEEPFGCALTDLNGHFVAIYSNENSDGINYATTPLSPYSSFKPLGVYAPAIENRTADWSTVYEDSPYNKVRDEIGNLVNWPENATGVYTNKPTTVCQAIKESLNTISVKCLSDYGVVNSIDFLTDNFNIDLDYERQKALSAGDDEVIGNIAMGYLYKGVSVADMAGYYQIFANGGKYFTPKAISKITDPDGKIVFENKTKGNQVISPETAFIMNKLLQGVVNPSGTGASACGLEVEAGGKTGTGTANDCHWFVGFVPQYSCAVWHGGSLVDNYSPQIFKSIMQKINLDKSIKYPRCSEIKQAIYCTESGLSCSENCKKIDMGYYFANENLANCKMHQ